MTIIRARWPLAAGLVAVATFAFAHGDVAPQPVNTDTQPDAGEEWLTENPYRNMEPAVFEEAIRSYIETRPDDRQVAEAAPKLTEMRDKLAALAEDPAGSDVEAVKAELLEINAGFETLSGAPVADSAAAHVARVIDGSPEKYHEAAELLTVSLSAAH